MTVPIYEHLRLHFQENPIAAFFPLLQKGFYVEITSGNILDMLCRTCGFDQEQVRGRIQTLFLNGKPVDDMATANVQDGDCLALSAAMPGLVGATMRSGGVLAGFRHSISHRPETSHSGALGGVLSIKLFNLLIKEMGPRFLQQGIIVTVDDLRDLLTSLSKLDCKKAQWNKKKINTDTLGTMEWPKTPGLIRLHVTFG